MSNRARWVDGVVHHVFHVSIEHVGRMVAFPCRKTVRWPAAVDSTSDDVDCMACIAEGYA